jgi:hypothetical protein
MKLGLRSSRHGTFRAARNGTLLLEPKKPAKSPPALEPNQGGNEGQHH